MVLQPLPEKGMTRVMYVESDTSTSCHRWKRSSVGFDMLDRRKLSPRQPERLTMSIQPATTETVTTETATAQVATTPVASSPVAATQPASTQPASTQPAGTRRPLPRSLGEIVEQCERGAVESPEHAAQLLSAAHVEADELSEWMDFDHPVCDGYGRRAVRMGRNFELMVMSWSPGDFSAIHDHGSTQWGAVQVFGVAEHAVFKIDGDVLKTADRSLSQPGQIYLVDHDMIHQMGNPGQSRFLSLHLYGNGNASGNITGDARIFNLLDREIQFTDGGVFFALPTHRINRTIAGIAGDPITTQTHHAQLRDRLWRMQNDPATRSLEHDAVLERLDAELID